MSSPAAIFHSNGQGGVTWTTGATATISLTSLATLTERCSMPWKHHLQFVPAAGDVHRTYAGMWLDTFSIIHEEGDIATFVLNYVGILSYPALPPPVYSLSRTLVDDPIDSHPDFDKFGTLANGVVLEAGTRIFRGFAPLLQVPAAVGAPVVFKKNPKGGIRSYRNPTASWNKSYIALTKPATDTVGKRVITPEGNPPKYGGKYDWLVGPMAFTERAGGRIYEIEKVWLLSGPLGLDQDIYKQG